MPLTFPATEYVSPQEGWGLVKSRPLRNGMLTGPIRGEACYHLLTTAAEFKRTTTVAYPKGSGPQQPPPQPRVLG